MPYLTVYIAPAGALEANGETSSAGHMWYSIAEDNGSGQISYGFAQAPKYKNNTGLAELEKLWCPGQVYNDDNKIYTNDINSYKVYITQAEYNKLLVFGNKYNDSSPEYILGYNDCVDFAWAALGGPGDALKIVS